MISKKELADGIRFAGARAAAAATYVKDWDHQLGHQWTTADAFAHVAATAGGAANLVPMLGGGMLSGLGVDQIAQMNAQSISKQAGKTRDQLAKEIVEGHEASAKFVESLADADLAKTVTLGGYEMPLSEIIAQIWIHHAIAHSYEASARWPIQ
ncbi:MAG: maleylpyruvate isomerase N-terminal domain-containing protein [Chloroflexi bacterium]|nr:maleylpyruvate isomerase N-terminal domain-containing protein [Chloroflexota bacterium]